MADRLKPWSACCRAFSIAGGGCAATALAYADIGDPTRPPPGFRRNATPTAPEIPPAAAVDQPVPDGRQTLCRGRWQIVRPGDPLGRRQGGRIDAAGVWMRIPGQGGNRLRQLKWLPEIVVKTPCRWLPRRRPGARMEKMMNREFLRAAHRIVRWAWPWPVARRCVNRLACR
jgi:hypothetical protein